MDKKPASKPVVKPVKLPSVAKKVAAIRIAMAKPKAKTTLLPPLPQQGPRPVNPGMPKGARRSSYVFRNGNKVHIGL